MQMENLLTLKVEKLILMDCIHMPKVINQKYKLPLILHLPVVEAAQEAVCRENFVCLTKGHSSRITQDKLFRRYGMTPNVILETDALEVGRRVALEAGACMLLPSIYIDDYCRQRRGAFFPLKDYENHRHFYACYRKDEFVPRYVRDFIQITTQVLNAQGERDSFY